MSVSERHHFGAVPWRPDELRADWLNNVLGRAGLTGSSSVVDVKAEPVGTGQMGDSFRLHLSYDGKADAALPPSVIGKFTALDESSRSTGIAMRTAEVEVRFYQQLAARLRARIPKCYFADVDPATARFVIIMQDMNRAHAGDQLRGCGVDEAHAALVELAAVHAPLWGANALKELEWLNRRTEESLQTLEAIIPALFEEFVERYSASLSASAIRVGERLFPNLSIYLRHRARAETIQHADFRIDNLLFESDGDTTKVAIVDWQTVVLGAGGLDASYLLGGSLPTQDRRTHEMDLLREYHLALVSGGVDGYSLDDCVADYRRYAYAGYVMAVAASMMVSRTDRGDEMFMAMANRHSAAAEDLDAEKFLTGD